MCTSRCSVAFRIPSWHHLEWESVPPQIPWDGKASHCTPTIRSHERACCVTHELYVYTLLLCKASCANAACIRAHRPFRSGACERAAAFASAAAAAGEPPWPPHMQRGRNMVLHGATPGYLAVPRGPRSPEGSANAVNQAVPRDTSGLPLQQRRRSGGLHSPITAARPDVTSDCRVAWWERGGGPRSGTGTGEYGH